MQEVCFFRDSEREQLSYGIASGAFYSYLNNKLILAFLENVKRVASAALHFLFYKLICNWLYIANFKACAELTIAPCFMSINLVRSNCTSCTCIRLRRAHRFKTGTLRVFPQTQFSQDYYGPLALDNLANVVLKFGTWTGQRPDRRKVDSIFVNGNEKWYTRVVIFTK